MSVTLRYHWSIIKHVIIYYLISMKYHLKLNMYITLFAKQITLFLLIGKRLMSSSDNPLKYRNHPLL